MADQELFDLDEIWKGDLFNRREEAMNLVAYIESVAAAPFQREDKQSFTLAIDAGYGEGKSFFIRRLAQTLALDHPVAFVDAWADDLADEPLVALAATLKRAIDPLSANANINRRMQVFLRKSGKVAKIAAAGLLRRGLGLLMTTPAVDLAAGVIVDAAEDVKEAINEGIVASGQGLAEDVVAGANSKSGMERRVAEFEEGRAAIDEMKASLRALVDSLQDVEEQHAPIIIVIDELDRCRPTYAIKLLEEIKHLFDVPGVVFIFATHREHLAHSICGVYGSSFSGHAYLARFIDRTYSLAEPELEPLLEILCRQAGLAQQNFEYFHIQGEKLPLRKPSLPEILAIYMAMYRLSSRDAFELVDILRTCQALSSDQKLVLPMLVPMVIGSMRGLGDGVLPAPYKDTAWTYFVQERPGQSKTGVTFGDAAVKLLKVAGLSEREFDDAMEAGPVDDYHRIIVNSTDWRGSGRALSNPTRYKDLIKSVSRFGSPLIEVAR